MTEEVSAHQQMMDAHNRGDNAGAQALSERVNIETGISPVAEGDASQVATHQPMPDAPKAEASIFETSATKLAELGPEGDALVAEWGGHSSHDFQENISYAREAFRDIVANRPDLIAKVDASGLGNDPAILKLLAEHGRMQANTLGDNTVANRYSSPSETPAFRGNGSKASLQSELNKIMEATPPGTAAYAKPSVQKRVTEIMETLHGTGNIVGRGGRTG
jgi:hypothetical protein